MAEEIARLKQEIARLEAQIAALAAQPEAQAVLFASIAERHAAIARLQGQPEIPPTCAETTIHGGVTGPVLSGTFTGPVNVPTYHIDATAIKALTEQQRMSAREQENRATMLRNVSSVWIEAMLEQSLYEHVLMRPTLEHRGEVVRDSRNIHRYRFQATNQPGYDFTTIRDVYEAADRRLLILGAPGTGKTTLLLGLTRDLLTSAAADETYPIPVVFQLASWTKSQNMNLQSWLIQELKNIYDVPNNIAHSWIQNSRILPLLDSLDEVPLAQRGACVEAINAFLTTQLEFLPLVVCCRTDAYTVLPVKLQLRGAVELHTLTAQQIEDFFAQLLSDTRGIQTAYGRLKDTAEQQTHHENHEIRRAGEEALQLLHTPLILNLVSVAYSGLSPDTITDSSFDDMFKRYVERRLEQPYGRPAQEYAPEQSRQWLTWLAARMLQHHINILSLERLTASWLETQQAQSLLAGTIALVMGLFGLAVGALLISPMAGHQLGIPFGAIVGIVCGLIAWKETLQPTLPLAERLTWSWQHVTAKLQTGFLQGPGLWIGFGLLFGILIGLLVGTALGWVAGLVTMIVVIAVLVTLVILPSGFEVGGEIEEKVHPNEGIHRSLRSFFITTVSLLVTAALGVGAVTFLVGNLAHTSGRQLSTMTTQAALLGASIGGLGGALLGSLIFGGLPVLVHYMLRLFLLAQKRMPLHYINFLDHAAARMVLYKIGGSYIFIHRMLLEYLAKQESRPSSQL